MRIERIEIDGFGRFHDARWTFEPGLTVLLGANEAGKTTLLNALRALLFGFEATRDGRTWYPPLGGGRRGGRLILESAAGERWTVERHGERGGGGALAVRAPNGNQGGQETLDRLLHGADKDLFTNIFAFGLGELQTFSSLSADGVRGRIYGAGAGLGGTSAIDLERRIRQGLDAMFLPRGSQRPLNQLLARIEELRREVADLARQPEEHAAAHRERLELQRRADALRGEARDTRERLVRVTHLRDAGPIVARLSELTLQLAAGDASLDDLAEDSVPVLDRRLAAVAESEAVLVTMDEQLTEARRARAAIAEDTAVLDAADGIAAVMEARARVVAGAARRRDLLAAVDRQEAAIAEHLARAGSWEEARLIRLDDSIPSVQATREHEGRLAEARARQAEAAQRRRAVQDELASLEPEAPGSGPTAEAALEARAAAFRELDGLRTTPPERDLVPGGAIAVAAIAVAAGVVVGSLLAAPVAGLIAGLLLGLVAVVVRGRSGLSTGAASEARRAALLRELELPATAGPPEITTAWEHLVASRARRELAGEGRARLDARRVELERREREEAAATEAVADADRSWRAWLGEHGLPQTVSPDAARHLLAVAGQARRAVEERDHQRRELEALDAEAGAYQERADRLCGTVGVRVATDDATRDARVAGIAERLEQTRAERRRAAELDARIGELEARRLPVVTTVDERRASVAAHLAATRCPDPESLRRRATAAAERRRIGGEVRELRARLVGIAGGAPQADVLRSEVDAIDSAALEVRELEEKERLDRIESEERAATSRIGALDAELRRLEAAEELGAKRQELVGLEGEAATMARDWVVRAVTLRLLEETRSRYERERQPDVVRAAESHFERITGGRYARIVAPPGASSVRVETDGGEGRVTDELSRGTGEQLYLALRFGLIEEFARHGEPLPVVMDDILVNFDADRAGRAASAIRELASRHQVLYFTCHPWTAELLDPGGERTLTLD